MDAISDGTVESVVIMSSSQVGKSEALGNAVGYYIDQDPAPIMMVMPTERDAEAWSKDRFSPMARDTPCLVGKIADPKSRDGSNKILHKRFPGGHLTIVGANAPSGLASRPIRILLCDEVDRYPFSAGAEGDPVNLAKKRTVTFWNRKIVLVSTPTIRGASRIETAYLESDQRQYWVPCPSCGAHQVLFWGQVRWESEGGEHHPETARYHCALCDAAWSDAMRWAAIRRGEWRARALTLPPDPGPGACWIRPPFWASCPSSPVPEFGIRCWSGAAGGCRKSRCIRRARPLPRAASGTWFGEPFRFSVS